MSATSYGWLVLAFPLAGTIVISLGWLRGLPGRAAGWIASGAILGSFIASILATANLQDEPAEERHLVDSAWTYAATADFNADLAILIDPLSVFMCLVVSGVSRGPGAAPTSSRPRRRRASTTAPTAATSSR